MEERAEESHIPPPAPVIGIIYNLKRDSSGDTPDAQAEYDSIDTVYAIRDALAGAGLGVLLFEADSTLPERLAHNHIDMAFNIAEGTSGRGREAQIPALLNMLGVPFTGSDETTLCIALDKALTKRLLSTYNVRSPKYTVFGLHIKPDLSGMKYPIIIKPNAEGSSKGISDISIVNSDEEFDRQLRYMLGHYKGDMLAEEYIEGREFTVGILGNGEDMRVFPPMEISFHKSTRGNYRIYSYNVKQDYKNHVSYSCPSDIDKNTENEMMELSRLIYNALGCRDFSRIDFRLSSDGKIYFIEINPLPGLAPGYSDYPMLAGFSGVSYNDLVLSVLRAGAGRYGITP
jgi:D-alanine-D-alanine ligase